MLGKVGLALVAVVALVLAACSSSDGEEAETTTSTAPTTETATAPSTTTTAAPSSETTAAPATTAAESTTTTGSSGTEFALAGDWFACEFVETPGQPPTDNCAWFDDDGLRFGEDGTLAFIERVGGDEVNCLFGNPGRCFAAELAGIEIEAEAVGTWILDGTTISVAFDGCEGTVEVEPGEAHSLFRPGAENGCTVLEIDANAFDQAQVGGVYFGPYPAA